VASLLIGVLAGAVLLIGGTALQAHAASPGAADSSAAGDRLFPPAGSRLIVQPASVGVVTPRTLDAARFTVTDGCGRTLTLGAVGVEGSGAAVPLPAQGAGPGTWKVSWTLREAERVRTGNWSFAIVNGTPCPGTAAAATDNGHHGDQVSVRATTGPASVAHLTPRPVLAFWLGLVAAGAMAAAGCALVAGRLRASSSAELGEMALVVTVLAATLTVSAAADGNSLPVRIALALPSAVLITGTTLAVTGQLRHRLARVLVGGMCATTVTVVVAAVLGHARSQLLAVPGDQSLAALPWQVISVAAVVSLLAAGGWFGAARDKALRPIQTPQLGVWHAPQ
jgi:hypothetical protein